MEQTLVYPEIQPPADKRNIEKDRKLLGGKGLILNCADQYIKKFKNEIECKELIIDINPLMAMEDSSCPDLYCIYRVPKRLRELNDKAYTPRLVSIGPFHHRREELKDMDIQKFLILKNFCNRRTDQNIEGLQKIIKEKEKGIRNCYSESFLFSSEGFVNMILLDAIFILELFRRKYEKDSESAKADEKDSGNSKAHYQIDYILSRPCMERGIQRDLLLLENQLPFFVLEELYKQYAEPKKTLLELSCGFFGDLIYINEWKPKSQKCGHAKQCFPNLVGCCCDLQDSNSSSEKRRKDFINKLVKYFYPDVDQQKRSSPEPKTEAKHLLHFTDLVRYFFCPSGLTELMPEPEVKNKRTKHLYFTATKLDEAGLKFTVPNSERDLLDIKFRPNKCLEICPIFNLSWCLSCLPCLKKTCLVDMQRFLEVPPLWLDDKTEVLFRNLMALEQCHYPTETNICDYIVLLDDLITTKDDVRLLVEKKIIVNELGSSKAVTDLVNHLALEIEESGKRYEDLCKELNDYYEDFWNTLVGTLTKVYFSNFFKGTATVAGIIVLGFTLWNFQRLVRWSTK